MKKDKTRMLDNDFYVIDLGYRDKQPIALVEKTTDYGKEYIIAFNYKINDNKIDWGYGYYYDDNLKKARNDFNKVLLGGNLADTFDKRNKDYNSIKDNPDIDQGTIFQFGRYICEVDDFNYDNPNESIVFIYKSKKDYKDGNYLEQISLLNKDIKQNIKEYLEEIYNVKTSNKNYERNER